MDVKDFDGLSNFISRMKMNCLKKLYSYTTLVLCFSRPPVHFQHPFPKNQGDTGRFTLQQLLDGVKFEMMGGLSFY